MAGNYVLADRAGRLYATGFVIAESIKSKTNGNTEEL